MILDERIAQEKPMRTTRGSLLMNMWQPKGLIGKSSRRSLTALNYQAPCLLSEDGAGDNCSVSTVFPGNTS